MKYIIKCPILRNEVMIEVKADNLEEAKTEFLKTIMKAGISLRYLPSNLDSFIKVIEG
jgi:hypothetical protein